MVMVGGRAILYPGREAIAARQAQRRGQRGPGGLGIQGGMPNPGQQGMPQQGQNPFGQLPGGMAIFIPGIGLIGGQGGQGGQFGGGGGGGGGGVQPGGQAPIPIPKAPSAEPKEGKKSKKNKHEHKNLAIGTLTEAGPKAYKMFTNQRHHAPDLAILVQDACKALERNKASKTQAEGLGTIQKSMYPAAAKAGQSFKPKSGFDLAEKWSGSDEKVIMNFFKEFDKLFFFGSLDSRVTLNIQWGNPPLLLGYCKADEEISYNTQVGRVSPHMRAMIVLSKNEGMDRDTRLLEYLATLLHEMCHAFLQLWGCDTGHCMQDANAGGPTGHAAAWQDICFAVEKATRKHLKLAIDCNRIVAYALEMEATNGRPSVSGCARWGFDVSQVNRFIQMIKAGQ